MQNSANISGTVEKILFQDASSGFSIFLLSNENSRSVVTKGVLPNLVVGQDLKIDGRWIFDPKYGKQFEVQSYEFRLSNNTKGLEKFLGSGLIKGIGKVYAKKLVEYFGMEVADIIEKCPERLEEVGGLGKCRVDAIVDSWEKNKGISEVLIFLQEKSIPQAIGIRLYKKYGKDTIGYISQNPYRLSEEIWGIGFKTADSIAQKMGFKKDSSYRIGAGIDFVLACGMQKGNLYIKLEDLKKELYELLDIDKTEANIAKVKKSLKNLYQEGKIKLIKKNNKFLVSRIICYNAEVKIAKKIVKILSEASGSLLDIDAVYKKLNSNNSGKLLTEDQIRGVIACLQNKISIITGGPGTGKTTIIKSLIEILGKNKIDYKLAAPTGRAAKRISESIGCQKAMTLHRLLEVDPVTMRFRYNEKNTIPTDFLIVDEASMIDVFLANSMVKALSLKTRLVLIGDVNQLPSVGAGNFLNDCIMSGVIPCIKLKEIFRQARGSLITTNAHRINQGQFPTTFSSDKKRDFFFVKEEDPANLGICLEKIYTKTLPKFKISKEDSIVLSPMHRGLSGTQKINQKLQLLLNPSSKGSFVFNGVTYKSGDRVMQVRNNYDKFVFNGDLGVIESISEEDRSASIDFDGKKLSYDFFEFSDLTLSYSTTIHKSQGSEYHCVIVPIFTQHFAMLQRNLLYTAVTRAKRLCILIGSCRAVAIAIKNNKSYKRLTLLDSFLRDLSGFDGGSCSSDTCSSDTCSSITCFLFPVS